MLQIHWGLFDVKVLYFLYYIFFAIHTLDVVVRTTFHSCGGELATVFAELMSSLWAGRYSAVAPRDFKSRLERFAQQFAGYEQHDSQG